MNPSIERYKAAFDAKQRRGIEQGHGVLLKNCTADELFTWMDELIFEVEGIVMPTYEDEP